MPRRSLKSQLNQIRSWVRQGRTDAWIAHQLEVPVRDINGFKREHDLAPQGGSDEGSAEEAVRAAQEVDLRAEDDALVAAELDAEPPDPLPAEEAQEDEGAARRRRRGRRGGTRTRRGGGEGALEGTFDHGEEGYGLWLDPAVQDDPVYAEHWAGHRPVTIAIEADQIVIRRAGDDAEGSDAEGAEAPVRAAPAVEARAAVEEPAAEEKPKPRRRTRTRKAAPPAEPQSESGPDPDAFDA